VQEVLGIFLSPLPSFLEEAAMIEGFLIGLTTAFSLTNLLMVIGGCLIGTFIGMLPGLGPMSIIAIMIPVAITLGDPTAALILLAGVYYGAIFGGSTSSILLNAPGVAGTVATSLRRLSDGAPGQGRQGADHRGHRKLRRRHDERRAADDLRPGAVDRGAAVPFGRVFRADGGGALRHRRLRRHRTGRQGADDDDRSG
jgi:hypothetical protein